MACTKILGIKMETINEFAVCGKRSTQPAPAQSMSMDSSSSNCKGSEDCEPTHHERSRCCFQEWMQLQRQDLSRLLQSLHRNRRRPDGDDDNENDVEHLVHDCIVHFQDYISSRSRLAQEDASPFFAPTWCTSLENSLLWVAGCRPSIFIRLLYALTGSDLESRLSDMLEGMRSGNLRVGDLSPGQMTLVNSLHVRTMREEEKLTSEMASSQEELADQPIAVIANEMEEVGEVNEEAEKALKDHEREMKEIMGKADELRMKTLKEVVEILKPVQAVEFLVASKKLHLSLHQWGKQRDERHGRRN